MEHFSKSKLCLLIASLGLVASGNVGAFPSAAWFPSASGTTVAFDSNGIPANGFVDSIKPKPVYINGQKGFVLTHTQMSGPDNDLEFFSVANDGFYFHGNRYLDGIDKGCTETMSPPVRIPDDIILGTPYTTTGTVTRTCIGNLTNSGSGSFTATFTPLLFENVIVPAGTFKALKMRFDFVASGGPFGGVPEIYEFWSAPKIGVIKDIDTQSAGGPYTHQAIAINSNVPRAGNADFDGDGKSDPTVFRGSDGTWRSRLSSNGTDTVRSWGGSGDLAVQGDYDGDGSLDYAVFRPSNATWYILKSSTNYTTSFIKQWGADTDRTVQRDYDGDGVNDIAVFRPSTGTWYILTSSSGFTESIIKQWGSSTDQQVPRDFDGDGKADLAVFRPSTGMWYITYSSTGYTTSGAYQWGASGDWAMAQDYDGDGKADLAVYRPTTAMWYIKFSSSGYTTSLSKQFGNAAAGAYAPGTNDTAVTGDFDGDRINDIAIFRPTTGEWFVLTSSSNFTSSLTLGPLGTTGDLPTGRR